jgi:hypothetical protein
VGTELLAASRKTALASSAKAPWTLGFFFLKLKNRLYWKPALTVLKFFEGSKLAQEFVNLKSGLLDIY